MTSNLLESDFLIIPDEETTNIKVKGRKEEKDNKDSKEDEDETVGNPFGLLGEEPYQFYGD